MTNLNISLTLNAVLLLLTATFMIELDAQEHRHANTLNQKNETIATLEANVENLRSSNHDLGLALAESRERVERLIEKLRAARYRAARLDDELEAAESQRRRIEHHLAVKYDLDDEAAAELAEYFFDAERRAEERYGVVLDPTVLVALTHAESRFDADVVSTAGAVGIMQVMPNYHVHRYDFLEARDDLFRPELNVRAGVFVFAEAKAEYGTVRAAVRAYHGGPRGVTNPRPSTVAYADAIFERLRNLGA